jgi:hypothetical protein
MYFSSPIIFLCSVHTKVCQASNLTYHIRLMFYDAGYYSLAKRSTSRAIYCQLSANNCASNSEETSMSGGCIVHQQPDEEPRNPLRATAA